MEAPDVGNVRFALLLLLPFDVFRKLLSVLHDHAAGEDPLALVAIHSPMPLLLADLVLEHLTQLGSSLRIIHFDLCDNLAQRSLSLCHWAIDVGPRPVILQLAHLEELRVAAFLRLPRRPRDLQLVHLVHTMGRVLDPVEEADLLEAVALVWPVVLRLVSRQRDGTRRLGRCDRWLLHLIHWLLCVVLLELASLRSKVVKVAHLCDCILFLIR